MKPIIITTMKKLLFLLLGLAGAFNAEAQIFGEKTFVPKARQSYTWKIRPGNVAVGASLMGVAFGVYAISSSAISAEIGRLQTEMGKLSNADDIRMRANRIDELNGNRETLGYVCGGAAIAGAVVIVLGLHKESAPEGIQIARGTYFNSMGAGFSLTKKF